MRTPGPLHHLAVCVRDLQRAERFYSGVLGLPIRRRWTREDGSERSLWLELGAGSFLAVEEVPGGPRRDDDASGWHCVALRIDVDERSAWIAHLAAAGVPIERESAYTLYVRDPEGALIALSHYPDATGQPSD